MFVSLRLRMLSEEPVPLAENVLAVLAKHLEVKLAFGETQTAISCHRKSDSVRKG